MGKVSITNVDDLLNSNGLLPTERSGGVPLFNFTDSERLLELCESLGIGVLGVEGFTLNNGDLTPEMDYIADFSSLLNCIDFEAESIRSARKFLKMAAETPRLLFEYVLIGRMQ
jgi:hypothetical protein